jgi:tight adherence protein B
MSNSMFYLALAIGSVVVLVLSLGLWTGRELQARSERYQAVFVKQAGRRMRAQFLFVDAQRVFGIKLVLVAGAVVLAWASTGSLPLVLLAAISAGLAPTLYLRRMVKQRTELFRHQLPDVLMLLAGNLRAGSGLVQAIDQMAGEMPMPAKQEFSLALRELRLGTTLVQALAGLERRMQHEEVGLFVAATRVATENGANLAEAFETLASTLRNKLALEDKIVALTAQGKMQAWVISSMPLVVMFLLLQIQPDSMHPLLHTWLGWGVLALVFGLELCGLLMIRKIVAIDV